MTHPSFSKLGLSQPILRALETERYAAPTPIQARAIPLLLGGRDVLGIAQTGTGKTAAFALPLMQRLSETRERAGPTRARALILAPTRELAIQITESFAVYGRNLKLRLATIIGGVAQGPQRKAMAAGVDVLVATPGRLLDLVKQGHVRLDKVAYLVLDEADRMLDMGFIPDVRRVIAALPKRRQSLLFSATMPADVERLAREVLADPVRIEVSPKAVAVDRIHQRVMRVNAGDKRAALTRILADPALARVLVFTRTKHRANRVAKHLDQAGISADALHGNKSQNARQQALQRFRIGKSRVLVATDIAARGIDIDDVTHVINFELPSEPESYVHRIGRTARAGAHGHAVSFCDETETDYLRRIERLLGHRLDVSGASGSLRHPPPSKRAVGQEIKRRGRSRRRRPAAA